MIQNVDFNDVPSPIPAASDRGHSSLIEVSSDTMKRNILNWKCWYSTTILPPWPHCPGTASPCDRQTPFQSCGNAEQKRTYILHTRSAHGRLTHDFLPWPIWVLTCAGDGNPMYSVFVCKLLLLPVHESQPRRCFSSSSQTDLLFHLLCVVSYP